MLNEKCCNPNHFLIKSTQESSMNKELMSYANKVGPNTHPEGTAAYQKYIEAEQIWDMALRTNKKMLDEGKSEIERRLKSENDGLKRKLEADKVTITNLKAALAKAKDSKNE